MFDATKLIVGQWYPAKSGRRARFLGRLARADYPLAFAYEIAPQYEDLIAVSNEGSYSPSQAGLTHRDITSDEPIRDPANAELSFTWYDAAVLSQKIRSE
jgi:hypothetical protein